MKKLLLPLLFLTTLSLSAEVIHEQKWDAPFTTKEVIFSSRRLAKVASQEKTPDGDAVLALRVIEKPDNTPHGAQLNLYGNADLKKGDKIRISFWIKGSEYGTIQFNFIQHGKPWKGISRRSIGSVKVRPEWQKVTYELTVEQDHQEPIRFPMFMLGAYPLNATLLLGPVRTEKIQNHLPLALQESWMLYPGVTPESLDWNALDPLPVSIGGAKKIPVTFRNNALDLESVAGRAAEGKPALLLNQFSAGSDGFMQLGVGADWWFDFLVNGKSIYDTLKTGNTVTPADVTNHVFNFPVRKGKNTVALFVKSGSEGWKVFCGAVPFREKLDNVTAILRSPEWRPVKMDPVEWVYVQPRRIPMLDVNPGTALDLSGFLDRAPKIGELGRIIVNQEGKLAYEKEPSRTVRFRSFTMAPGGWQNRLYAMSKPEIEEYAEAIRLRGFNMVRIQAPDGALTGKNGYPKKSLTLREATLPRTMEELPIDKTFADRWDYFVACLRKRNIYLLPDIASTRTSWTAATVEFDVKTGLLFRKDYRENWRAGFHYMMKHRNPYTGTRMVDDPMIVGITLFNEQDNQKNYWNELNPYWQKHFAAVHPGETAPVLNLELLQKSQEARSWLDETLTGMSKFYMEEVRNVGFRGIVTNWDMYMRLMDIPPRLPLTAVAMHTYFSHPNRVALPVRNYQQKLYNLRWYRGTGFLTGQTSSITDRNSYIGRAGVNRFFDRPFLITEYSHSPYNRYVHEAGLMWGAYAALQGWDMLTQHGTTVSLWHTPMNGYVFEGSLSPMARVNEILTAFAWQRGDVAEAAHKVEIAIPERVMHSADFMNAIGGEYSRLFMVTRLGCSCEGQGSVRDSLKIVPERFARTFGGGMFAEVRETRGGDELARQLVRELREKRVIGQNNLTDPDRGIYQSETGEITTDVQKQTLRVVTKRLEGAVLKENQPMKLDALTISESSVPASLTAVALDAAPDLRSSRRILLVAATMAVSEHTVFNNERFDVEIDFGKFPVLIRSGNFALTLENRSAGKPEVYALNLDGTREKKLDASFRDGKLSLRFDTSKFEYGTPFFEILFP